MISEERLAELWREHWRKEDYWHDKFARAVEREARREALEDAEKACDGVWDMRHGQECAAAIRALTGA